MIYKIGDENEIKMYKMANGKNGDVYRNKKEAIKLFTEGKEPPMTEDVADYLTRIKTSRILLPRKLVFYRDGLKGYTLRLVKKPGKGKKIITFPRDNLINNVRIIEEDIRVLSSKKILLNGITPDNAVFNGKLYLVDPANYKLLDVLETEGLERLNRYQFHILLTDLIIRELKKEVNSPSKLSQIKELLLMKDDDKPTSEYLEEIIEPDDTIKKMVKKL